jgi:hypothetical protein
MSANDIFTHAVVCIGSNEGVLLPIDDAAEAVKILARGVQVEYSWSNSNYKYRTDKASRRETLKLELLTITQLATMELEKETA